MSVSFSAVRLYRAGMTLLAFAWAFYWFGYIASLGTALLPAFVLSSAFAAPIVVLALRSRSIAITCVRGLMLLLLAWIVAYSWLSIESALLLRTRQNPQSITAVQRHWPFANSAVVYVPQHGILWQD